MGLRYSKSVRFGAVRFNFSGSGIGISAGIPGLRIGTGPRGAYISGGVGGFRYRRSLNTQSSSVPVPLPNGPGARAPAQRSTELKNVISTQEHDTLSVLTLTESDSDGLLQSINEQRRKVHLWPFVTAALFLAWLLVVNATKDWAGLVSIFSALLFVGIAGWVFWRDKMAGLTVLFFEPDTATSGHFDQLCEALSSAAAMHRVKAVASTSQYANRKYSAGAGQGLKFSPASIALGNAPGIVANVMVPVVTTGRTTLAFYPDRVLAFQGKSVGSVSYDSLNAQEEYSRFVEGDSVPRDASVVDQTWQYVNRNGGPDRRFKDNRQLPVCAYTQLNLTTASGLDIRLMGSRERGFEPVVSALARMN